jgi:hypothetical protein
MGYTDEDRWADWRRRIDTAYTDISGLQHNRFIWKNIVKMLTENPGVKHHSIVNAWLVNSYTTTMAVGIRRQHDRGAQRPMTVGQILKEMVDYPTVVTEARVLGGAEEVDRPFLREWWADLTSTEAFAPLTPEADLARLSNASAAVRHYVNKALAHSDSKVDKTTLSMSFADLDASLDVLVEVFKTYYRLLRGKNMYNMAPIVDAGWLEMFDRGWLPEDFMPVSEESFG